MGGGVTGDVMAERANDALDIKRDDRFVFDNQNVGSDLTVQFLTCGLQQVGNLVEIDIENDRHVAGRETLHGHQQQSLSRWWGQFLQVRLCTQFLRQGNIKDIVLYRIGNTPDAVEYLESEI